VARRDLAGAVIRWLEKKVTVAPTVEGHIVIE
jgi:hypothetical protein